MVGKYCFVSGPSCVFCHYSCLGISRDSYRIAHAGASVDLAIFSLHLAGMERVIWRSGFYIILINLGKLKLKIIL